MFDRYFTKILVTFVLSLLVGIPLFSYLNREPVEVTEEATVPVEEVSEDLKVGAAISYTPTILPLSSTTDEVGTSSRAYRRGTFKELCFTADTCRTTWPTGGAGGGLSTTTPFNNGEVVTVIDGSTVRSTPTTTVSETVTGLELSANPTVLGSSPITLALTAGFNIPLTASTTNWNTFYDTPSTRITAGTNLSWSGNTLNATVSTSSINYWRLVSGGLETSTSTDFARAAFLVATSTTGTSTFAGAVGIGTTTPIQTLSVVGDARLTGAFFDSNASSGSSGSVLVTTGSATAWTATSSLGLDTNFFQQNGNSFGTTATLGTNDANNLAFETGGTTRVLINTSGNVGIGTTNPVAALDLGAATLGRGIAWGGSSGTGNYSNIFTSLSAGGLVLTTGLSASTTADAYQSSYGSSIARTAIRLNPFGSDAGAIQFFTDSASTVAAGTAVTPTERMRITSAGNVGIGTSTPFLRSGFNAPWLTIAGAAPGINLTDSDTNTTNRYISSNAGEFRIGISNNDGSSASDHMFISSVGNVGIGTTTPASKLVISTGVTGPELVLDGGANARGSSVNFYQTGLLRGALGVSGEVEADSSSDMAFWANTGSRLRFYSNGSTAERMVIDTNGNVGIGASTSPISRFTVTGLSGSTSSLLTIASSSNAQYVTVTPTGNVGIGSSTPSAKLSVVGDNPITTPLFKVGSSTQDVLSIFPATSTRFSVGTTSQATNITFQGTMNMFGLNNFQTSDSLCINSATGTVTYFNSNSCIASSIKFKENVLNSSAGLDVVRKLRAVSFDFKPGMGQKGNQLGLIAEEVAAVDPRLADYDKDGNPGTLDDFALISVLVKAVQELDTGVHVKRMAEENWQWGLIGLLGLALYSQHRRIKKLENAIKAR